MIVVGHARSGTTILLSALNTSPQVHLLSEPFSYKEQYESNFRDRFNAVQARYGLQACKASYAPLLPDVAEDADNVAYFAALSRLHAVYGEKIALATPRYGTDVHRLQAWIERRRPRCLFVFRSPQSTLESMPRHFPSIAPQENVFSYAMTVCLYLDLARVLPHVAHIVHEDVGAPTFAALGRWLGADLGRAHECYAARRRQARRSDRGSGEMATLNAAYDFLVGAARQGGVVSPALSQIGGYMGEGNTCELAKLYYELRQIMEANRRFTLAE